MASIASLTLKLGKTKAKITTLKVQAAAIKTLLVVAKGAAKAKKMVKDAAASA